MAQAALDAYLAYVKARVQVNLLSHRGAFEERVFYSDQLFKLAKEDPKHKMVEAARKTGPNSFKIGASGDKYERQQPVNIAEFRALAAEAKADLRDAMNLPDTDGSDLSGEALVEKREAYSEAVHSLAAYVQSAQTEALALAAALQPATVRSGWRASLTPHFTRDLEAERAALREDYKVGLPKSAWLSGLQNVGVTEVTEAHVQAAVASEEAVTPPRTDA